MSEEASKPPAGGQPVGAGPGREHTDIARSAGVVGGLTLVSRVSGLARDVVVGALFGASTAADAFFIAFRIPNLFRRVVAEGATSAGFVPVFSERLTREGPAGALRAAGAVGGVAFLVLASIVGIGVVFAELVVALFAPGFAAGTGDYDLAVELTRWTFPYLLFVGLAAWAMALLHTFRRFTVPALGPILLNVSIVVAALMLHWRLAVPVYALVVGVLVGGLLQFAVQVPTLGRLGMRPAMLWSPADPAVGRVGRLLLPALLGGAVYQVNVLVATIFASLLPERSVSYLWYADRVFEFPLGVVAVAVGTVALPSMSGQAGAGRFEALAETVSFSLRVVWMLAVPATVGIWMLAPAIVTVIFERGAFTPHDSQMTAWALRAYVVGMIAVASTRVLVSAFYALQRVGLPVLAACIALAVNAVADVALMGPPEASGGWWGAAVVEVAQRHVAIADLRHAGLALGAATAAIVNALLLLTLLKRRLSSFALAGPLRSAGRHVLATVPMALVVWLCGSFAAGREAGSAPYVEVGLGVPLGAVAYLGAAAALGSPEVRRLLATLRRG